MNPIVENNSGGSLDWFPDFKKCTAMMNFLPFVLMSFLIPLSRSLPTTHRPLTKQEGEK